MFPKLASLIDSSTAEVLKSASAGDLSAPQGHPSQNQQKPQQPQGKQTSERTPTPHSSGKGASPPVPVASTTGVKGAPVPVPHRHADPTAPQPSAAESGPSPSLQQQQALPVRSEPTPRPEQLHFAAPPQDSPTPSSPAWRATANATNVKPTSPTHRSNPLTVGHSSRAAGMAKAHGAVRDEVNSDDDFVFILENVHSTRDAIAKIHEIQNGRDVDGMKSIGGGKPDTVAAGPSSRKPTRRRTALPETLHDFYACPNYIVSLVVARQAVFEDALSGFHSLVKREEAEVAEVNRKRTEAHRAKKAAIEASRAVTSGGGRSGSSGEQPRRSHAPFTCKGESPNVMGEGYQLGNESQATEPRTVNAADKAEPCTTMAAAHCPTLPTDKKNNEKTASPPSPGTAKSIPSTPTPPTAADEEVPASLMFLWRSRDEAALRAMNSPIPTQEHSASAPECARPPHAQWATGTNSASIRPEEDEAEPRASGGPASPPPSAEGAITNTTGVPVSVEDLPQQPLPLPRPQPMLPEHNQAEAAVMEAVRREEQYMAFLRTKEHARRRAPEVFHYVYPPYIDFVKNGGSRLTDPADLRLAHRLARANPQNHLMKEWLYVWEQFERDIHREVLLIEGTSYNQADEAIAAIISYVEHAYHRGQQAGLAKLDAAHDDRKGSGIRTHTHTHAHEKGTGAPVDSSKATGAGLATDADSSRPHAPQQQQKHVAAGADKAEPAAAKAEKKGFFDSIFSAGAAALKGVAIRAHETLPSFMSDPLVAASGLNAAAVRAATAYPTDPLQRGRKVFNAVREVVLASQQSFMGFPYQLLCEQVGTERLALALEEYLEEEQEEFRKARELVESNNGNGNGHGATTSIDVTPPLASERGAIQQVKPLSPPGEHLSASDPVPVTVHSDESASYVSSFERASFGGAGNQPGGSLLSQSTPPRNTAVSNYSMSLRQENSVRFDSIVSTPASPLMPPASPSASSRVLRIYHGGQEKSKCRETPSSSSAPHFAVKTAPIGSQPAATKAEKEPQGRPTTGEPPTTPNAPALAAGSSREGSLPSANASTADETAAAAHRLLDERRREREKKLPLLVGEPRPAEFRAFLDVIRAKVEAKNGQEREWKRRHQQRRKPSEMSPSSLTSSVNTGSGTETKVDVEDVESAPCTSSPAIDINTVNNNDNSRSGNAGGGEATKPHYRHHSLFRSDVDGSAYLLPLSPPQRGARGADDSAPTAVEESPESNASLVTSSSAAVGSRHLHGMRIHIYFNTRRNAPVVCVNKVFRLFTVPGLHHFSADQASCPSDQAANSAEDGGSGSRVRGSNDEDEDGRCLLLLIQIEFTLFTQEVAEVRWRWYTV